MGQPEAPTEMIELAIKVQHCVKADLPAERLGASIVEVKLNLLPSFQLDRERSVSR